MNNTNENTLKWMEELAQDSTLWSILSDKDTFYPSSILFEFQNLKEAIEHKNIYGSLLLIRDVYESSMKIPVLMALIVLDAKSKITENQTSEFEKIYNEILYQLLSDTLSMGSWNTLASLLINKKRNRILQLPDPLFQLLDKTTNLYSTKISSDYANIINWRNSTIGHGKCRLVSDPSYEIEVKTLLVNLSEYFKNTEVYYQNCYFRQGNTKICGNSFPQNNVTPIHLQIGETEFSTTEYIHLLSDGYFFFDTFLSRKKTEKHIDHVAGKEQLTQKGYFHNLYQNIPSNITSPIRGKFVTRESDKMLAQLHESEHYITPTFLINKIEEAISTHEKGVIMLYMERGMEKSALINKLDGMYHEQKLLKNSTIRCYYCSNSQLRGAHDFVGSFNTAFCNGPNYDSYLRESDASIVHLSYNSPTKAEDFADIMLSYQEYYEINHNLDYLIYCIDGIDELTEENKSILDFIPTWEQLEEGTFVILTSRLPSENTIDAVSRKNIELAEQKANCIITVTRKDEEYQKLLKNYINGKKLTSDTLTSILDAVDYRFLYLKVYMELMETNSEQLLNTANAKTVFASYMDYLCSSYGKKMEKKLKFICAVLAIFKEISILELFEYITCESVNYPTIGCLNDLLPLLVTTRKNGINYYELANIEYEAYVLSHYTEECFEVLHAFTNSMLQCYLSEKELKKPDLVFLLNGVISFSTYASMYPEVQDRLYHSDFITVILSLSKHIYKYRNSKGYMEQLARQFTDTALQMFLYCAKKDLHLLNNKMTKDELSAVSLSSIAVCDINLNHWISHHQDFTLLTNEIKEIIKFPDFDMLSWHHFLFPPVYEDEESDFLASVDNAIKNMTLYLTSGKGDFLFREFIHVIFTPNHYGKTEPRWYLPYFEFINKDTLFSSCNDALNDAEKNKYRNLMNNIQALTYLHPTCSDFFWNGKTSLQELPDPIIFDEFAESLPKNITFSIDRVLDESYYKDILLYPAKEYMHWVNTLSIDENSDLNEALIYADKEDWSAYLYQAIISIEHLKSSESEPGFYTDIYNSLTTALRELNHCLYQKIQKIIVQNFLIEQQIDLILPAVSYFFNMLETTIPEEDLYQEYIKWYKLLNKYVVWDKTTTYSITLSLLMRIMVTLQKDTLIPHPEFSKVFLCFNQEQRFQPQEFALFLLCYYHEKNNYKEVDALLSQLNSSKMSWSIESQYIYITYLLGLNDTYKKELLRLKNSIFSELTQKFSNFDIYTDFNEFRDDIYAYMEIFYRTKLYEDGIVACDELQSFFENIISELSASHIDMYQNNLRLLQEHLKYIRLFFTFLHTGETPDIRLNPNLLTLKPGLNPVVFAGVENFIYKLCHNLPIEPQNSKETTISLLSIGIYKSYKVPAKTF